MVITYQQMKLNSAVWQEHISDRACALCQVPRNFRPCNLRQQMFNYHLRDFPCEVSQVQQKSHELTLIDFIVFASAPDHKGAYKNIATAIRSLSLRICTIHPHSMPQFAFIHSSSHTRPLIHTSLALFQECCYAGPPSLAATVPLVGDYFFQLSCSTTQCPPLQSSRCWPVRGPGSHICRRSYSSRPRIRGAPGMVPEDAGALIESVSHV